MLTLKWCWKNNNIINILTIAIPKGVSRVWSTFHGFLICRDVLEVRISEEVNSDWT